MRVVRTMMRRVIATVVATAIVIRCRASDVWGRCACIHSSLFSVLSYFTMYSLEVMPLFIDPPIAGGWGGSQSGYR